jgi:glucose/arabinose dehydrogenase
MKRPFLRAIVCWTLVLGGVWPVVASHAADTRFWNVSSRVEVEKGELDGLAVDADGTLSLAPTKEELAQSGELYFWKSVGDPARTLYVGTGDNGQILAVDRAGTRVLCDLDLLEVMALAKTPRGTLFAGGAPGGTVYEVDADGKSTPYFQSEQGMVWDLALAPDGQLLVATGETGKLYRVHDRDRATLLFEGTEPHIMSVTTRPDGAIVFGTAGDGLVYELDPNGTTSVLYDAAEEEIRAVVCGEDGSVYVAANVSPPAEGAPPDDTQRPAVYRLGSQGAATRIWQPASSFLFDLEIDGLGGLIAATGEKAGLHRIDVVRREASQVVAFDEGTALSILQHQKEVVVSTGDPAKLYSIGPSLRSTGTFTSEARDAGAEARWSRVRWTANRPSGTNVRIETRVGNRETPDVTWSEWLDAQTDGEDAAIVRSPEGRFLQWRLTLEGNGSSTPAVSSVTTSFREVNLAPLVTAIEVSGQGQDLASPGDGRPRGIRRQLSSGIAVDYSLPLDPDAPVARSFEASWAVGLRTASWAAQDPNGDALTYSLSYRPVESTRWLQLAKDLREPVYTWDASAFPDGDYQLKVVASDETANGVDLALTTERVSETFGVDNTAPVVSEFRASLDGERIRIEAKIRDDRSAVVRAELSTDGQEWRPAHTTTGLLDARSVQLDSGLVAGDREKGDPVVLRAFDEAGNRVVARVFLR